MPQSPTELIKEKLDILEFLRGYLTFQRAGKNFKALCPFHKEKTPSFMISPERQTWHCFGCNLGGDIFAFLMRYENIEFSEALKVLAEKVGVELRHVSPADYKYLGLLYELNDEAKKFYERELQNFEPAKKYLAARSLTAETVEEFELGWAPNDPDTLTLHLVNRGYSPDDVLRAGLAFKNERGLKLDRFRGRIVFPIHNHFGKTVGFTGRLLPEFEKEDVGKYINSPETSIFNKSRLLYGFWKTKNFIRPQGSALLVEGQMDMLMCWQAGIKNVVATSGTALTADHLKVLRRLTDQLLISFDNDDAGLAAGERAIDLAEINDFNARVLLLKDFKDPAEAVQEDPETFKKLLSEAPPAPEFYIARYLGSYLGAPSLVTQGGEFKKDLRVVLGKFRNMASAVLRSLWIHELSRRLGIEEKILLEETEKLNEVSRPSVSDKANEEGEVPAMKFSRRELLSQYLLAVGLARENLNLIEENLMHLPPEYQEIFRLLKAGKRSSDDRRVDSIMNLIVLKAGTGGEEDLAALKKFIAEEYFKEKRGALTLAIKKAEIEADEAAVKLALEDFKKNLSFEEK